MGLNALEIFKLLPKTNCKECGFPTCLAFSMQLALGKVELSKCPYVSEEAKGKLLSSAEPPIRTLKFGRGEGEVTVGGETVLFRHEKTFYNPTGIGVMIEEGEGEEKIRKKIKSVKELEYERVGLKLKPNLIAIKDEGKGKFLELVKETSSLGKALILMSDDPGRLKEAAELVKDQRPLLYAATSSNYEPMGKLARELNLPLVVRADSLEKLAELTQKLDSWGVKDLVLNLEGKKVKEVFQSLIQVRRAAILGKLRALGYPTLVFSGEFTSEYLKETLYSALFIAKYASIVVLSELRGETLFPLLVERLNLFTDPQRPLSTPEGVYEIGTPKEDSPVLVTTNFSLTYFIVSGEIENSRIPSYLLVQDTEGLSVLTAWAADKFNAETISGLVKKTKIEERVKHRKIIIPGTLAQIVGELEEELSGWEILLGPREAASLPAYLRMWKSG